MEHGATNKRRFAGSDPHMNFADSPSPVCFFFIPAALAGRKPQPPVRQRKRLRPSFLFSDHRERETKIFLDNAKKKEGFCFGWVKRDFIRAKRKLGTTLGKAGISFFLFSFETVYLFGSFCFFTFLLSCPFPSCIFEHGAQGKKQQTSQPAKGKTARVQGGMDWEPIIRASILFFLDGDRFWSLGFRLE